jgi:SAM-dependent methyltransferase
MHPEAREFVARTLADLPPRRSVVEIGSRQINGSIRDLLNGARYTGLDLYEGPGVDVVTDAATWDPPEPVDTVICCEVLEHVPDPTMLLASARRWLAPGGVLIVTAASYDRPAHSGVDGGPPRWGEHYANIGPTTLACWLEDFGFGRVFVRHDPAAGDVHATAFAPSLTVLVVRSGADFSTRDVEDGLVWGLKAAGHEVREYDLLVHLSRARSWLLHNHRRARRTHPDLPKPDLDTYTYWAGKDVVTETLLGRGPELRVPDWVVIVTGVLIHPSVPLMLKRAGAPVAVLLTESPYLEEEQAEIIRHADLVWTNERTSLGRLNHPNVRYLPHAYHPERHSPDIEGDPDTPAHDVVFVGTGFPERIRTLAAVDWTGIDLGLYGGDWTDLPSRHPLRRHLTLGKLDNARAAALYRRARIGLNLYRSSEHPAESLNPRAYELAACGAFHLSEYRAEVDEVFGHLVPTFEGGTELEAAIRYWLPMADGRDRIGRCLTEAVAGHSWADRARQIARDLADTTPALPEKALRR